MPEIEISQDDIVGLADALDGLALPAGQRALLSAIVGLAAEVMANQSEAIAIVDGVEPAVSFQEQFASSFTPGAMPGAEAAGGPTKMVIGRAFKIGRDAAG